MNRDIEMDESASLDALTVEINRVVRSPYPTQLKVRMLQNAHATLVYTIHTTVLIPADIA